MLSRLTDQLRNRTALRAEQITQAVTQLTDETVSSQSKADFLSALAQKGESVEEISQFARELRALAVVPVLPADLREAVILDVVGTGGDRLNTFNISTTVALVVAAAGVTVAKHGNRAVTSKSGSADVLEALGVPTDLSPEDAVASLRDHHFAFFFAPRYHPAFKHIIPARKLCAERGQRTIFNFLGPLLNPVRPSHQLVGVPIPALCETLARVLQSLGVKRGMVVCGRVGEAYMDELSILGENTTAEFSEQRAFTVTSTPFDPVYLQPATLSDLVGGDHVANAGIVWRLLAGDDRGPKRDAVLLNAGAALLVANVAPTLMDGWALASDLIDQGKAMAKLQELTA